MFLLTGENFILFVLLLLMYLHFYDLILGFIRPFSRPFFSLFQSGIYESLVIEDIFPTQCCFFHYPMISWSTGICRGENVSRMEISPWLRVYKVDWLTRVVVFRALPLKGCPIEGLANTRVRWEEDELHSGEFLNIYSTSLSCLSILFSSQKGFLLDLGLTVQTNSRGGRRFRVSRVSAGSWDGGHMCVWFCPCPKNLHKAEFKRGSYFGG